MTSINPTLTTRDALESWLLDFHKSTATLDAKHCTEKFFTSNVELQYANNPVATGRENAQGFFDMAFKALDIMTHEIVYFDFVAPNKLYQAAKINYVVKGDDPEKDMITIPAMMSVWLEEQEGKLMIRRNEIYLDASGLFGRMGEKGLI
ncbi:hypothetical protein PMZ80_007343 [Knufia obscura]|uniref:SnoaL-like domain-containing protein n=2 Tax=Knufia TaxID=430999 RepID=A0AAN8I4Z6_9EURO|nr:hypothetical protein PMZ80_007343 [Knufia obscura]KAK5950570.1 hypothetical protein OHC33_008513 [Knufia fluminis]